MKRPFFGNCETSRRSVAALTGTHLMICQRRPSTRCGVPLVRSLASMLTMLQPMLWAEVRASVRFSCLHHDCVIQHHDDQPDPRPGLYTIPRNDVQSFLCIRIIRDA